MKIALIVLGVLLLLGVAAMAVFVYIVQNVEQPAYRWSSRTVTSRFATTPRWWSLRSAVRVRGKEALSAGFGPLARYIFAKEGEPAIGSV